MKGDIRGWGLGWILALLTLTAAAPALGQNAFGGVNGPPVLEKRVSVELLSENAVLAPGEEGWLALRARIDPHWHTYWVNAGDAGQAMSLDWTAPEGVEVGPIVWPSPERISVDIFTNYGYEDQVTLLTPVRLSKDWPANKPVELKAEAFWLVCEEICIPEQDSVAIALPTGPSSEIDSTVAAVFMRAREALPRIAPFGSELRVVGESMALFVEGLSPTAHEEIYFYPDALSAIEHAEPQTVTAVEGGAEIGLVPGFEPPQDSLSGILSLTNADGSVRKLYLGPPDGPGAPHRALDIAYSPSAPEPAPTPAPITPPPGAGYSVFALMALAFLGGLLLNLMPCVFPVLAIKAFSLAGKAHAERSDRIAQTLAYGAGVMLFFLALGALMISLKSGGVAVGWGFQLQNPVVVAALAVVFLLAALNLSGLFEFRAPSGFGDRMAAQSGPRGAFFTGALAVIAATPCMAPFMATAIPAALSSSAAVGVAIFAALGLGMATPMIALGLWPGLARLMPRPGAWMLRFREFLSFPMYASAGWMLWVLSGQVGRSAFFWALMGVSALALAAWAYGISQRSAGRSRFSLGLSGVSAAAAAWMVIGSALAPLPPDASDGRFSRARLEYARSQQEPVFVYLTADWCLTCKVNERVAFNDAFKGAVSDTGTIVLKGDWTRPNPEIQALLDDLGLAGIPVYAIYPADGGAPQILPQFITEDMLVSALLDADAASDGRVYAENAH